MPRTHQSYRTLAPSALMPQTPHDDPGPNPPRFPPSPKRPPAQRPQGLRRNNSNQREGGAEPFLLRFTEGGLLSSAFLGAPALQSEVQLTGPEWSLCTMTDSSRGKKEMGKMGESPSHSFPGLIKRTENLHKRRRVLVWQPQARICGVNTDFSPLRRDPILPFSLLLCLSVVPHQRGTEHQLT